MLRSRLKSRSRQELLPRRSIYDTLSGRDLVTRCSPPIVTGRFRDADHARQLGENRSFPLSEGQKSRGDQNGHCPSLKSALPDDVGCSGHGSSALPRAASSRSTISSTDQSRSVKPAASPGYVIGV